MTRKAVDECRFQLQQIMLRDGEELMANQPWATEQDRWIELVFAVLAEVSDLPEDVLREAAEEVNAFGLLSIPRLAIPLDSTEGQTNHRRLVDALVEAGLPDEKARRAAEGVHDIAVGLSAHFDAYLQRYLRYYGEMMLADLDRWFTFKTLSGSEAANAFTYWLQNAVLMPLSNIDAPVKAFCADLDATPADMIEAADQLGANLSLLDDLALLRQQAADLKSLETRLMRDSSKEEDAA